MKRQLLHGFTTVGVALLRLEEAHDFDMVRLGEHVHWLSLHELVAAFRKACHIACPSGRIAAHVRYTSWLGGGNAVDDALEQAGTWRIDDERIELSEHFKLVCDIAAHDLDIHFVVIGVGT